MASGLETWMRQDVHNVLTEQGIRCAQPDGVDLCAVITDRLVERLEKFDVLDRRFYATGPQTRPSEVHR